MSTVLIAEDERDLSSLLWRHLEDEGFQVLQAYGGQAALGNPLKKMFCN